MVLASPELRFAADDFIHSHAVLRNVFRIRAPGVRRARTGSVTFDRRESIQAGLLENAQSGLLLAVGDSAREFSPWQRSSGGDASSPAVLPHIASQTTSCNCSSLGCINK
jgi:hypothetical protein